MGDETGLLRAVLDASPDGVAGLEAVRDASGEIVDFRWLVANVAASAMMGRDSTDLVGSRLLDLDPDLAEDGRLERFVRVVQTRRAISFRRRVCHPTSGELRTYQLRVSALDDGVVVTSTDVTATLSVARDPQAEAAARRASKDGLTGLPTGWALDQLLDAERGRADRYRRPLAVVALDVDHFHRINDAHGREAGDRALQILTRVISSSLRTADHMGRMEGAAFLMVLPETSLDGAFELAERVRQRISTIVVRLPDATTRLTVSLGVAGLVPGENRERLVMRAKAGLDAAKRGGRDRVELAPAA